MEHVLGTTEQILRNSGAPALRLGALATELRNSLGRLAPDGARLRTLLERHPDRFRVLDPWRGPWRRLGAAHAPGEADPWVVAVRDLCDTGGCGGGHPLARRVRESVRWLALNVDPSSPASVIRWQGLLTEGMAAAQALDRAA